MLKAIRLLKQLENEQRQAVLKESSTS